MESSADYLRRMDICCVIYEFFYRASTIYALTEFIILKRIKTFKTLSLPFLYRDIIEWCVH